MTETNGFNKGQTSIIRETVRETVQELVRQGAIVTTIQCMTARQVCEKARLKPWVRVMWTIITAAVATLVSLMITGRM